MKEYVIVYKNDASQPIGWGYLYTRGDGKMMLPELWDMSNLPLAEDVYILTRTNKQELVILNRTIQ